MFELQTKIKAINLSDTHIKTQGFLLNKNIVGIISYPLKKIEFWNIVKYKFIYITDKTIDGTISIDCNIINLKDDSIIIGNMNGALKFSFKKRSIVKEYNFSIDKFYQMNDVIYIIKHNYISKFDLLSEKYSRIASTN